MILKLKTDDNQLNLFGIGLIDQDMKATTLIRSRLGLSFSSACNENDHNLLKSDLIAHFGKKS